VHLNSWAFQVSLSALGSLAWDFFSPWSAASAPTEFVGMGMVPTCNPFSLQQKYKKPV